MPKCVNSSTVKVGVASAIALTALWMGGCRRPIPDWLIDDTEPVLVTDVPADLEPSTYVPDPVVEAPPTVVDPPAVAVRTYTVRRGDTLWSIAQRTYGDGKRWQDIMAANEGMDPTRLRVGQKIVLP